MRNMDWRECTPPVLHSLQSGRWLVVANYKNDNRYSNGQLLTLRKLYYAGGLNIIALLPKHVSGGMRKNHPAVVKSAHFWRIIPGLIWKTGLRGRKACFYTKIRTRILHGCSRYIRGLRLCTSALMNKRYICAVIPVYNAISLKSFIAGKDVWSYSLEVITAIFRPEISCLCVRRSWHHPFIFHWNIIMV